MIGFRNPVTMEEITDPAEVASAAARRAKFDRNLHWFESRAQEIGRSHPGKCICIAGDELFVGDTAHQALALARTAHPEDDGYFLHYIHKEKAARIYAHPGFVAGV